MRLLDLTLGSAAENVALDEALLEQAEQTTGGWECLRIWEPPAAMVVVGRGSCVDQEVDQRACHERQIPIVRRTSGGNAIVAGPGCLMYALILSYQRRPALRQLPDAHRFVLEKLAAALRRLRPDVTTAGISDLAVGTQSWQKISGNSARCRRHHLLYHGTVLYEMSLDLVDAALKMPPRQPDYRQGRAHADFLVNLSVAAAALRNVVVEAWQPTDILIDWPVEATRQLVAEKFGNPRWTYRR
jgi:lipoate-protein ligase A